MPVNYDLIKRNFMPGSFYDLDSVENRLQDQENIVERLHKSKNPELVEIGKAIESHPDWALFRAISAKARANFADARASLQDIIASEELALTELFPEEKSIICLFSTKAAVSIPSISILDLSALF